MKVNFNIPKNVSHVTQTLVDAGFEAFLVGGCVRDLILDTLPNDWDITTNATPDEVIPLFEKAVHENDFGTVAIVFEDEDIDSVERTIEVTTYRSETTYSNNRHPDSIEYATTLSEDLKRRDFTMNALAYDPVKQELIDEWNGRA
jgi:tRNA nucleotidyltransferase (CCA-adding enzyme)